MTTKGGLQRRQQWQTLFAQRGQIAANASKGLSSCNATEAPGDFLLHLDHPKISFGQIIVKIHTKILQKVQDGFLLFTQAIEQIARITLFASTPFARWSRRPRMSQISFIEHPEKLCFPINNFQWVKPMPSLLARLFCCLFHIQQQDFEVRCPLYSLLFEKNEIPQQVHHTSGVLTVVQEVRSPSVMDRDPYEIRQNPNGFQCSLTPARIDVIVREGRRAGHMHPLPFSCHIQSCFILMDDRSFFECLFDLLLHWDQLSRTPFDQVTDVPFTHLDSQQVAHHLARAGQWQQLLFDQIHRSRSHIGSILDGSLYSSWKCRSGDLLAVGTLFLLGPIFPYQHPRQRQLHDLTPLSSTRCHRVQVVLAGLTVVYLQLDDLIWRGRERQARSRVSWLPTRFLLALLAQALRFAHKPIRGGRQVAIVAIFREPVSQGFQLLAQAAHLLLVVLDHGVLLRQPRLLLLDEFVSLRQLFPQTLILFSQIDQFFFDRHARTLLGLTPFGKSPVDLGSYRLPSFAEALILVTK